ncbi:hypothetical protein ACHAXT_007319 [Thalassiosira profunda]
MAAPISSQQRASVEVAVALLETCPDEALAPHLERLERLVHKASGRGDGARGASRGDSAPIIDAVLTNDHLLGHILDFDGSLAYYHKFFNYVVGYESPLPLERCELSSYFAGTKSNALVCKKWKSMVIGQDGLDQWTVQCNNDVSKEISIAADAAKDKSLSWTARMCAMAIANDVDGLTDAFRVPDDTTRGIGAALEEQRVKDDDSDAYGVINLDFEPVPFGHPFSRWCMWNLVEDIPDEDCMLDAFVGSIAYAAALRGSIQALQYLDSFRGGSLWDQYFDEKGDYFLNSLVGSACSRPALECIVDSIAAIFPGRHCTPSELRNSDMLHWRHRGGNGNHLHLAAARGHKRLVEVLLAGGMNPNRRCERIGGNSSFGGFGYGGYDDYDRYSDESSEEMSGDPRDRGVKQHPLPEHWARIRGHDDVADLLASRSFGRGMSDGVKHGTVKK